VDVLRLVVREGSRLTAIGLGIGLVVSLGFCLVLDRLLVGMSPVNIPVFVAVMALLAGVAALACYLPARRAVRIDPLLASDTSEAGFGPGDRSLASMNLASERAVALRTCTPAGTLSPTLGTCGLQIRAPGHDRRTDPRKAATPPLSPLPPASQPFTP